MAVEDAVTLKLPPRQGLLPLAEDALRRLARESGLTPALEDMLVGAVLEACEELLRTGRAADLERPFELVLDFSPEAAEVALVYDGRIPLNPHLTEPYEVPTAASDAGDVNLDTLWLHLIKHRMDRVFFEVKGPVHALRLVKYRRDEGEEKRLWFLGMAPRLRPGLNVQFTGPDQAPRTVLLQDFQSGKVFQFGPSEALAVGMLDGRRTLYDIYLALIDELGPISPHRLGVLYETLEGAGMLATADDAEEANGRRSWLQWLINPVFSIPHADACVEALHRWVRPLVSPLGAWLLIAAGLSGAIPLWLGQAGLTHLGLPELEQLILRHPWSLLAVYANLMLMVACHELAHGVVCKHYGGRVPRMGMMLYLASFIFFCDTTAAWTFPRKRQRLMVSLAGPLVSWAFLGGALWGLGHFVGSGSFWEPVFLLTSLLFFFGLLMNFNPFIRMDAYYMLMDLTGIGNLREKSFRFLGRRLFGRGLPAGHAEPAGRAEQAGDARQRAIYWLYGVLGVVFTVAIFALPFWQLAQMLAADKPSGGILILSALALAVALFSLSHKAVARLRGLRRREYKLK